jgi:hypothetical protein
MRALVNLVSTAYSDLKTRLDAQAVRGNAG